MQTEEQLIEALKRADAAGNTEDAQTLANAIKQMRAQKPEPGYRATADDLFADLGMQRGTEQPQQQTGNPVSRAIGYVTDSTLAPGILGGAGKAIAGTAEAIAADPVQTLVVDPLTAPSRMAAGINDANRYAWEGRFPEAGQKLVEGATAAGETALVFGGPIAGAAGRNVAAQGAKGLIPKPRQQAVERLMEADPNLATTARNAQRLQSEGIPANVADLTTRQGQSRLKGAARRDGPAQDLAQDALDPRAADQSARLTRTIEDAFGVQNDFLDTVKGISETKRELSKPLYEQAYSQPTKLTTDLVELVKRPPLQKALRDAEELAAIDGVRLQKIPGDVPAIQVRGANGATRLEGDTARLHYMRRALDDQIDAFRDPTTGKLSSAPKAQALVRLRKQFNEAIREANPAFKEADSIWSEGTAAEQAMERGVKAASMRTERQVRQMMDDAVREGDQEFFELGFAQGLIEKVGGSGSDFANRTLRLLSPENQKITRTVLGNERGEALLNRLRVENLMSRTRNRISPNVGSDTAENVQQSAAHAISMLGDLMSGNPARMGANALRIVGQKKLSERMVRTQQEVDEQLIRLATEDPEELLRLIQEVNAARAPKPLSLPDLRGPAAAVGANQLEDQTARAARQ